jgi:hypothetical protein
MKFGFVLPYGDARSAADLAREAEQAGWDGFFVWEPVWGIDAWVALTAAAMLTERIRLGTMLSPISRMRPWKLASETATLDNLSGGRVILSVGLGAIDTGFEAFGETTDRKIRAELLDEGLDILTGLWQGQPFQYVGKHYHIAEAKFYPPPAPVQKPRIPIWVVGAWHRPKSMERTLRYDGILPLVMDQAKKIVPTTNEAIRDIKNYIQDHHFASTPFDIVVEGKTPAGDPIRAAEEAQRWDDAGATWWIEALWSAIDEPDRLEQTKKRILAGPPRS